jgi:hypothetical protein
MTDNQLTQVSEPDEDVLILDVPDDALERAAVTDGRIVTLIYCSQDYFSCWPQ